MKTKSKYILFYSTTSLFTLVIFFSGVLLSFGQEPWRIDQLMEPADLAQLINDPKMAQPILFSIGPSAVIKNSIDIGAVNDKVNWEKLRLELGKLSPDAQVVIYCGCCPFNHCPNIRPAFNLMNEMKFKNHKLLNLTKNIKVNWIDKDYPVND
jgi:hypothetical protein